MSVENPEFAVRVCAVCGGKGKLPTEYGMVPCFKCGGAGEVSERPLPVGPYV